MIIVAIVFLIFTLVLILTLRLWVLREEDFQKNAVYTTGKNITKSYCDKQWNNTKLILVTLPNGKVEQMKSKAFNQKKAIPLGQIVHVAYRGTPKFCTTFYELRILDEQYIKIPRIPYLTVMKFLTGLMCSITGVLFIVSFIDILLKL